MHILILAIFWGTVNLKTSLADRVNWEPIEQTMQSGKVYLLGAGPGGIAYLTVQGHRHLLQAEVLIYDALVDPGLLKLAPGDCLMRDVGKRGGHPSPTQEEINKLLVEYCQAGKQVVRLKSGDPFIFGRTASEIAALQAAGCDFEVVPGLSAALAVPLLAGIPLTDPQLSRCFGVVSAHDPERLNWSSLAGLDTLVVLMGGRHLEEIVARLQEQGRSPQTPVAIVRWGGHPQQQVWRGTLAGILAQTADQALSPSVIVVGEVAALQLQPASRLPRPALVGKTVLVTRAAGQSSEFEALLARAGAQVIEMPALEIGPPSSWGPLDREIAELASFDWLILTSANGVDFFLERLLNRGQDVRALAGLQIAVVGQKTAASLRQWGLQPDFVPPDFVADQLVAHFPQQGALAETRVLFPRVESGGRQVLVAELSARGAEVVEVPAYQSGCPATIAPAALQALQTQSVDAITFASSKTVRHFCQLLDQTGLEWQGWLEEVCLASIGPQTSKTCSELLGRVDVEAEEYTLEGLTQALIQFYQGAEPG